jgi:nitrile hydratase
MRPSSRIKRRGDAAAVRMVPEPRAVLEEFGRAVLKEFGTETPDADTIEVHGSTADVRFLVVPERPAGSEDLDEQALNNLITRDSMIWLEVLIPYRN